MNAERQLRMLALGLKVTKPFTPVAKSAYRKEADQADAPPRVQGDARLKGVRGWKYAA